MFDEACALLDSALSGDARREIVAEAAHATDLQDSLRRLRERMRADTWRAGARHLRLAPVVKWGDHETRRDGFHALHDWDGIADAVNEDTIPVDVLSFVLDKRVTGEPDAAVIAILLDYYFMHLLGLLSLRIWDAGDADANLDRLDGLLARLQGPHGSGQPFAADAETLILIATSHYEIEERGYDRLLDRVRTLAPRHRTKIALGHAASIGSHLRFGFEATYDKDLVAMRHDNVADYPWLCFALATLMEEYARMHDAGIQGLEREMLVEAMLNGLSADARAFVGPPPACLASCAAEHATLRARLYDYRQDLVADFEAHRPSDRAYSPLSFFFNFSHNVLKGTVIDALLWGEPRSLTFNDLLSGLPREDAKTEAKLALAKTLMSYARANPHTIRGRRMPVIVYDPPVGRRAWAVAVGQIRDTRT
jgi:hypothetical protein